MLALVTKAKKDILTAWLFAEDKLKVLFEFCANHIITA